MIFLNSLKNNTMKEIVFLYKRGHSENEIKNQLELKGFNSKQIKTEFNKFYSTFKTVQEVLNN